MIRESLLKYKNLTEAIIVNVKNDLDGQDLLEMRRDIIVNLLEDKNISKDEIKNTYIELNIDKLDNILKEEIDKAMKRAKEAIKEMNLRKNASKVYNNINSTNIFNKKI